MEKKRFPLVRVLLCLSFVVLLLLFLGSLSGAAPGTSSALVTTRLEGRVYEGQANTEPPNAIPLQGVTVKVYGSTQPDIYPGDLLGVTTTNASGWFGVDFTELRYTYYNLVETDPSGYYSVWASSVGGTKKNNNWIQYTAPIAGSKTTTGNKFWDLPRVTRTPTPTPAATRTRTPTPTLTATRPGGATPTPTATSQDCFVADFAWAPRSPCAGETVQFTNLSRWCLGTSHHQQWDLGNGGLTGVADPSTEYNAPGIYTVTLTIWNDAGASRSVSKQLTVQACTAVLRKVCRGPGGGEIHVGDVVTCTYSIHNTGGTDMSSYKLFDQYPADYIQYQSASPELTAHNVWQQADGTWVGGADWEMPGPIPPGGVVTHTLTFRARKAGHDICDLAALRWLTASGAQPPDVQASACLDILDQPHRLALTKKMLGNPTVLPKVGDIVEFQLEVENLTGAAVTFTLEDSSYVDQWDLVSAFPVPDVDTSDGVRRTLVWQNRTLGPYGKFVVHLEMKVLLAGVTAENCATVYQPDPAAAAPGTALARLGPVCVYTRIAPEQGRHLRVWKRFTVPSSHVANVGDTVAFATGLLNAGSDTIQSFSLYDAIVPAAVTPQLPWFGNWAGPWPPASSVTFGMVLTAVSTGSPAVNTATWKITWADGTVETRTVSDYLYITDGETGRGLFIDKWRSQPAGFVPISDTIIYHVTITNVTGVDLATVPLMDVYPTMCLTFLAASPPPDVVLPGKLVWHNIGPLALGAARTIDVRFHADAPCPNRLNCASSQFEFAGAAPQTVADCEPVEIDGRQPRLTIQKTRLSPSPAMVGDLTLWQIVVKNAGTAPLAVVPLHDGYQKNWLTYDSAIPAPTSIDLANGRLDWANIGPLAAGQSVTVTLRLKAIAANVGVLNCAETRYTLAGVDLTPYDCATVDIREPRAGIQVVKALLWPEPPAVLALGDVAVFSITVRNTGMVTLTHVVVTDDLDPECWRYLSAPGRTPTLVGPGVVTWEIAVLAPGEVVSWRLLLRAIDLCQPMENCVGVAAMTPQGPALRDGMCLPVRVEPRRPGLSVRKVIVEPSHLPEAGEVVQFALVVRNTGGTTLGVVEVTDTYAVGCLRFVNAVPPPESVDTLLGQIHWDNVGPLAAGDVRVLRVFLQVTEQCHMGFNCVEARVPAAGAPGLMANACVDVPVRILTEETPTPTATRPMQETPTPTATSVPGAPRLYVPLVLKLR